MVITGLAFLLFWLLFSILNVAIGTAALVTAIVFVVLGLLNDERPWVRRA